MAEGFRWATYYCARGALLGALTGVALLGAQGFAAGDVGPRAYPWAMTTSFVISLPASLLAYPAWATLGEQLPQAIRPPWFLATGIVMPTVSGLLWGYLVACVRVIYESRRGPQNRRADL